MKPSKIIIACACCALAGVAVGFGLGRSGIGGGNLVGAAPGKKTNAANDTSSPADAERSRREMIDEYYPDIAGLKTPAGWRGYLERWVAAECPDKNLGCARECLRRWAEHDADAALAFVHASPRFAQRNSAYAIPLGIIGRKEMPRVIGWMRGNLPEVDRSAVGECVIGDIMREYPRQAMELAVADEIPIPAYCFTQIMQMMARVSIADAQQMFTDLPESEKTAAADGFAMALARNDPKGAVAWCMQQQGAPYGQSTMEAVFRTIAQTAPAELPALFDLHGAQLSEDILRSTMYFATSQNPAVAIEIMQKLPPEKRQRYGSDIVLALFDTDADQAVAAASVLLPEAAQFDQIYRGFEMWAQSDRKAAEAWLESEADAGLREQIRTKKQVESDPLGFLTSAGAHGNDSFAAQRVDEALRILSDHNAPDAVGWLLANPEQITAQRLSQVRRMAGGNIPITMPDICAMPDGGARQATIGFMADTWVAAANWNDAAELVPMIDDAGRRDALRFKIFSAMMAQPSHQENARQWLATQPLSAEVRASWEAVAAGSAGKR